MANQPKQNREIAQFIRSNRWVLVSAGFLVLLYLLGPVLTPFLIAATLAYISDPIVDKLSVFQFKRFKLNRTLATTIVLIGFILLVIALFLILIPLLQKQSILISQKLPMLIDLFHTRFEPWLQTKFGVSLNLDIGHLQNIIRENWQSTGGMLGNLLKTAGSKGMVLLGIVTNILLIPIVLFYLLRDWDDLIDSIRELIPQKWQTKTTTIAKDIDNVLAEFLRGQLSVMLALSAFYSIGLTFAGLDMALSIGLIAGVLSFVPFVGFALAFVLALILALLQFTSVDGIIPILIVFGLGQILEGYVLTPFLLGDRIGLHPAVIIFALMAGGQLFGFAGVLIALPVSAAIAVGLKHLKASYLKSDTYLNE